MPSPVVEVILPVDLQHALQDSPSGQEGRSYTTSLQYYLAIAEALESRALPLRVSDALSHTSIVLGRLRREPQHVRIGYLNIPLPPLLTYTVAYQGILGCCEPGALVQALDQWLRSEHRVEQIHFTKQRTDSPIAGALVRHRRTIALAAEAHWRLELPHTFDELLARHSSKHRQRLRWERRKLEESMRDQLTHAVLGAIEDVEHILDTCEGIGTKTYHAKVGGMVRKEPVWRAVLETLAASGSLACHLFRDGEHPLAFVLTARHDGVAHVLAMAHLPEYGQYSPGKHLLLEVLRDSCERGMRWVDYGFGDAQYKQVYGSHCEEEGTFMLFAPTLRARVTRCAIGASSAAHSVGQRVAGAPLANSVKRYWRKVLGERAASKAEGS